MLVYHFEKQSSHHCFTEIQIEFVTYPFDYFQRHSVSSVGSSSKEKINFLWLSLVKAFENKEQNNFVFLFLLSSGFGRGEKGRGRVRTGSAVQFVFASQTPLRFQKLTGWLTTVIIMKKLPVLFSRPAFPFPISATNLCVKPLTWVPIIAFL